MFELTPALIGNNSLSGLRGCAVCLYKLQTGTSQSVDEFLDLSETIIPLHDNLYRLGDFNLYLDNSTEKNNNTVYEVLGCFNYMQHCNFPFHVCGS